MFPTKKSGDFLYGDVPHHQDLIISSAGEEASNFTQRMGKGRRPKKLAAVSNNDDKKIMRKEIERQRRQQMAKLYAKLRSLLPLDSIKGKRAVSDHMNEAVNYVNYLKKRIQELSLTRDGLKNFGSSSDNSSRTNFVEIHSCVGGVEIVMNSGVGDKRDWHLSTMMFVILEQGLDVVRSVSSQTNEGFFHTFQCEISNPNHQIDLLGLQTKLNALILGRTFDCLEKWSRLLSHWLAKVVNVTGKKD